MTPKQRLKVFNSCNGRCAYCGIELQKGWHVDHVQAIGRHFKYDHDKGRLVETGKCSFPENKRPDNLLPSCPSCNITKSSMDLDGFKWFIGHTLETLNKNHNAAYKFAKRYGQIQETPKPVIFYFETLIK